MAANQNFGTCSALKQAISAPQPVTMNLHVCCPYPANKQAKQTARSTSIKFLGFYNYLAGQY